MKAGAKGSPVVLGVDVGTTGCKALAVDETGRTVGTGYAGYGIFAGEGGRVEQDPAQWVRGVAASVRQAAEGLDAGQVIALSLSTQGASSLLADENLRPLTPAVTWMDGRAAEQAARLRRDVGDEALYGLTGWRAHPSLDLAKARWLAEHEPGLLSRARWFVSTLEYVNHALTGVVAIDPSNAAIRQFYDISAGRWDPGLVAWAGIGGALLPPILPSGACLGRLTAAAAAELGLHEGVLVFNGGHDQYCGALGAALPEAGTAMLSAGTAWVLLSVVDRPVRTPSFLSFGPHVLPGFYGALASLPAAGAALDWLRNNITGSGYGEINREGIARVGRNEDLFFFPHLGGPSFPDWPARAKGAFTGLDLSTDRIDLATACMEGVALQARRMLDEFERNGIAVHTVKLSGGAANSPLWVAILAAATGRRIRLLQARDAPCVGAACLAGAGAGVFGDCREAALHINPSKGQDPPAPALSAFYDRKYRRYRAAWDLLKAVYEEERCDV